LTRTQKKQNTKNELGGVIEGLNGLIADNTVYYQKTRHYHWNVEGEHFFELHEVFEKEYTLTAADIDLLAERVRAIHGVPTHTLQSVLNRATLEEDESIPDEAGMVDNAVRDLEQMIAATKEVHGVSEEAEDLGTTNMLEDMIEQAEKRAWMLRAFLRRVQESG
jgi:starvation-inducible DNA-binding protein